MQNILILGSGGREHAFALQILKSAKKPNVFVAPGNAGTEQIAKNLNIDILNFQEVKKAVLSNTINLVVVGPEAPLVLGIHDFFLQDEVLKKIPVIGPQKNGAKLEGSKEFSKKFMEKYQIPTAKYQSFTSENITEGNVFLEKLAPPYVLKADGLAGGKGVLILENLEDAQKELENMLLHQKFGNASEKVVIEAFLDGIELSVFVLTDGKSYKILPAAKDYKRIGEGDTGLNTGGMGAVSPVDFADADFLEKVEKQIVIPTIKGLKKEKIHYKGFLFIGLMNVKGNPYVIEYNVRMGDPETQVVLPRIKSDFLELLEGVAKENLSQKKIKINPQTACTVVVAAGGYPEKYEKNKTIKGLEKVKKSIVFHAGTQKNAKEILSNGGRVLAFTSFGDTLLESLEKSYASIENIHFSEMNYRKDIGFDLIKKKKNGL